MPRRGRKDLTGWLCHFVHGTVELENIYDVLVGDSEIATEDGAGLVRNAPLHFLVDFVLLNSESDCEHSTNVDTCEDGRSKVEEVAKLPKFINGDKAKGQESFKENDLLDGEDYSDTTADISSLFPEFQKYEEQYPLSEGAGALDVLFRIIESGHLRASWSFRGGKPTIYGDRAACCFTEMPLYALIRYADDRQHKFVSNYGIAIKRDELFRAGARPVIYGLTGQHLEVSGCDWPRYLKPDCGIGIHEQYRYVSLNLSGSRHQSDWMHEREWRWPFKVQEAKCPGLSLWLNPPTIDFDRIYIFVATEAEAAQVLNKLKLIYDASLENDGNHDVGDWQFSADMFMRTYVFSIEAARKECSRKGVSPEFMRIEDIPKRYISSFSSPEATPEMINRVRESLKEARAASIVGAQEFRHNNPIAEYSPFSNGYANVYCISPQSPVVSALRVLNDNDEELVFAMGDTGYCLDVIAEDATLWPSAPEAVAAGEAAVTILRERLPEAKFEVIGRLD